MLAESVVCCLGKKQIAPGLASLLSLGGDRLVDLRASQRLPDKSAGYKDELYWLAGWLAGDDAGCCSRQRVEIIVAACLAKCELDSSPPRRAAAAAAAAVAASTTDEMR